MKKILRLFPTKGKKEIIHNTGFLQDDLIESIRIYLDTLKINDYVIIYENEDHIKLTQRQMQHRLKPKIDKLFNEDSNVIILFIHY